MRVLVTGGAGFIGSHIVDALLEKGHDVLVMDDYSSGRKENLPADTHVWMPGSITYRDDRMGAGHTAIKFACETFKPDVVCHQAAQPSLRRSIDDPAHDATVNIIGTINVIQAARACGAHLVFASTSAVYADVGGNWEDLPLSEGYSVRPTTPYGLAKLTTERYIEMLCPSYTILRYGNVYGPRQVQVGENQLIPHCLAHLLDGQPFTIHGDGRQTRDFVYVRDIARANILAIEEKLRGIYNCGTGEGITVNEVCYTLADMLDITITETTFAHDDAKPGEARHVALDSTKAFDAFGWRALTPLEQGLKETVGWWRERS